LVLTSGIILKLQILDHFYRLKVNIIFLIIMCFPLSGMAKLTTFEDSDGDGLSDQYEESIGTESYLSDTDGDGVNDAEEIGKNLDSPLDTDGDGRIDVLDLDDDNDGLPSILEGKGDTDHDGLADYLDPDSDNDGISDGIESGMLGMDKNHDFIDDAFDAERVGAIDRNGDGINDALTLPDQNNDGVPDYLDAGVNLYSKKTQPKTKVTKKENADKSQKPIVINRYTDTDNDGLLDSQEISLGTNPLKRDSDGDTVSDAIEIGLDINAPLDSDHDGIIDALDPDDDNDLILTVNEDLNKDGTPINDDTDDDGVPNYLDANDDGDSKLTINEGVKTDIDNDGIPDYLDKNDGVDDRVATRVNQKESILKDPEVIVLFDGDVESLFGEENILEEKSGAYDIAEKMLSIAIENAKLEEQDQTLNEKNKVVTRKVASSSWSWQLF